jgi:hypothetical protein
MTSFKRQIGRLAARIGVAAALLVLGLEAPAFAAAPTITSFTPTSGPMNCVVSITGTAFTDFTEASTTVSFVPITGMAVDVSDFSIISATQIWAKVPGLTPGGTYKIRITNDGGTDDSDSSFLSTSGVGDCAPTITYFVPCGAPAGTTVVIFGTNLLKGTDPTDPTQQTEVRFFDYATGSPDPTLATHTTPNTDTPTELSVLVPFGAKDGPIRVTTFSTPTLGQVFSAPFMVPPPDDCPHIDPAVHTRNVTLNLRKHLVARGKVTVTDGFTACTASVPVKIQRRVSGHWRTVGSTTTSDTGAYKKRIRDKGGKYRARATRVSLNNGADLCSHSTSRVRRHPH